MPLVRYLSIIFVVLLFAACESADERAEKHYQNALALLSGGDVDRAIVEFRNVFRFDGQHRDARADFAALLRREGRISQSYSQYLRLVEQFPDDLDGLLALSEMAMVSQRWDDVARHGARFAALAPNDPKAKVIDLAIRYQNALALGSPAERRLAAVEAAKLVRSQPDAPMLRYILIDVAMMNGDSEAALTQLDEILPLAPDRLEFHNMRVAILNQLDRPDELEAQLLQMIDRFPDEKNAVAALLQFYERRTDFAKAESFLRGRAARNVDDIETQQALLRFLGAIRGPDAVLAEIDRIVLESPGSTNLARLRAETRFSKGEQKAAIADIEDLVAGAEPSTNIHTAKVSLARMLVLSGDPEAARIRIDEVLAEDSTEVEALKMRAAWLIDDDEADRAIAVLRTALDQEPSDTQAITLMAQAHTRNGNHELARDFLSLAVEASNSAPRESIQFAQVLMNGGQIALAEQTLTGAVRRNPDDLTLLGHLGRVYVAKEDWARLGLLEKTLRAQENQAANRVADGLETTRLTAQNRTDDAIALLENMATQSAKGEVSAHLAVIRARLMSGDAQRAAGHAKEAIEANPDNIELRLALASTQFISNNLLAAEVAYREIIEINNQIEAAWTGLVRTRSELGDKDAARDTLEEALDLMPGAVNLLWAKASFLEQDRDIDGAIEVYEALYKRASNSAILANNLASLLSNVPRRSDQPRTRLHGLAAASRN